MLSVIYAGCHIQALYAECHYAECRSSQLRQLLPPTGMSRGDAFYANLTSIVTAFLKVCINQLFTLR
jgi:hypothetical protein